MELRKLMSLTATAHIEELLEFENFAALEVMSDFAIGIIWNMLATHKAEQGSGTTGCEIPHSISRGGLQHREVDARARD